MVSERRIIAVPVSRADWLGGGAGRFWQAARGCMSAWLVEGIQATLEREVKALVGAGWHSRSRGRRRRRSC